MNDSREMQKVRSAGNGVKASAPEAAACFPACKLARLTGTPAGSWTVDDLIALVRDQGIRLVSLMHIGGDGWLKTLDFVPRDLNHLKDILTGGERCDGSSIFHDLGISAGASDIVLRPRPASAFLDPFAAEPTLVVLCSHLGRDGKPLPESPDTILRAAYARLHAETGVDLHALGEDRIFPRHAPERVQPVRSGRPRLPCQLTLCLWRKAAPRGAGVARRDRRTHQVRPQRSRLCGSQRPREMGLGAARNRVAVAAPAAGGGRRGADPVGAAESRAPERHAVQLRPGATAGPCRKWHALPYGIGVQGRVSAGRGCGRHAERRSRNG